MCGRNCVFGCCRNKSKGPEVVESRTVVITNTDKPYAEEPLADWEKELLMPDKDAVVHMYPADGITACDTKLDDGTIHLITGNLAGVSCKDCRINALTYYNEQLAFERDELKADVIGLKEKARVAEQATGMVRRELRHTTRNLGRERSTTRQLRESLDYERNGYRGYRPVPRYPY